MIPTTSGCNSPGIPPGGTNNKTTGLDNVAADNHLYEIYPNPSKGMVTISCENAGSTAVKFLLYDISGRLMHSFKMPAGTHTMSLDLRSLGLASGIYNLSSNTEGAVKQQRLVYQAD